MTVPTDERLDARPPREDADDRGRRAGERGDALPKPHVARSRWPFPFVWVVPLAAAILAGYYLYQHHRDEGREIVVEFADATDVRPEETAVRSRGVEVGRVVEMTLSADRHRAQVHVRLKGRDNAIGRRGATFWIVRPDVSSGDVRSLGTIVSGAYIEATPGEGSDEQTFSGMDQPPLATGEGALMILHAERVDKLQVGSQVHYRGQQVGIVQDIRLSDDARRVNVSIFIRKRYLPLVRTNSKFWLVSGTDVKGGVLTSFRFKLGSVQSLLAGSVSFATPDKPGDVASERSDFDLFSDSKEEWIKWTPSIDLPAADGEVEAAPPGAKLKVP